MKAALFDIDDDDFFTLHRTAKRRSIATDNGQSQMKTRRQWRQPISIGSVDQEPAVAVIG